MEYRRAGLLSGCRWDRRICDTRKSSTGGEFKELSPFHGLAMDEPNPTRLAVIVKAARQFAARGEECHHEPNRDFTGKNGLDKKK